MLLGIHCGLTLSTSPKTFALLHLKSNYVKYGNKKNWITQKNELGPNLKKFNSFEFSMK
jgi:hypothetical protein